MNTDLLRKDTWLSPDDAPAATSPDPLRLGDLPRGATATVTHVETPPMGEDHDVVLRLIEIGFVPGERVRVLAHGFPGREPIAVRVGNATFALRRFEADYIRVAVNSGVQP
ncbi:FeoA family protein [Amphibiibacter pelophylacis]|uniref:FeoA family protein n=1 Tax=Amphibiibacter pelophylacis TaxID=1799477 RepID=A0ACC6P1M5_9BURK